MLWPRARAEGLGFQQYFELAAQRGTSGDRGRGLGRGKGMAMRTVGEPWGGRERGRGMGNHREVGTGGSWAWHHRGTGAWGACPYAASEASGACKASKGIAVEGWSSQEAPPERGTPLANCLEARPLEPTPAEELPGTRGLSVAGEMSLLVVMRGWAGAQSGMQGQPLAWARQLERAAGGLGLQN